MPHESPPPKSISRLGPPGTILRLGMISGLVGLTSLAVGATTSPWLVPPYLAAMAWLLVTPSTRRAAETAIDSTLPLSEPEPLPRGESATDDEAVPDKLEKPKTGRGRGRKPRAKAKPEVPVEKPAATWVQVAPGKFVRVEMPVEPTTEPNIETDPPTQPEEPATVANTLANEEPQALAEVAPEPTERREIWRETPLLVGGEPPDDPDPVDPPEFARLVAVDESVRPIQPRVQPGRSARVRPDPRAKLRRGNGRVGAVPRVVLHRG